MPTTSAVERVGFVGLGIMGLPMARNLLKAGFPLAATNRTISRAEPLRAEGAPLCRTPKEVAERSDVVITIVTSSPDVEAVTFGPDGIADGAHDGLLAVDMSTISPDVTRDIARRAADRGFRTVDAPVSGGEVGAIEARLSIMIGGEDADVARAMPLFRAMGKTIVHMGPHGAGQATKLANQIAVALNNLGVSEALVFAAAQGIDLRKAREVIAGGAGGSWAMVNYAPKILDGDFAPGFMVDLQQKDLRLVLDAAYESKTPLPGTSLSHELYTSLQRSGEGSLGNHALIKAIERLAKVEARAKKA
ncbi:MAG: NAD(P)-dependent oxidoreductase [Chloroflexota bacterium]|nr:NAD(P)-dependent oxidoreductase [Chloroflexota bacterium]